MKRFDIPFQWSERYHSWIDELRFAKQPIEIFREPGLPSSDFVLNKAKVQEKTGTDEIGKVVIL